MYKDEYWNSMLLFEISGHNSEAFFSEIYTELINVYVYIFKFFITYVHNDYRS